MEEKLLFLLYVLLKLIKPGNKIQTPQHNILGTTLNLKWYASYVAGTIQSVVDPEGEISNWVYIYINNSAPGFFIVSTF